MPQEVPVLTGVEDREISKQSHAPAKVQNAEKQDRGNSQTREIQERAETRPNSLDEAESQRPKLEHVRSHISTHDAPGAGHDAHWEQGDEVYEKFSHRRKIIIVTVLSFSAFLAPISSTSILSASPEVVATYNTTGTIFDVSNALYLVFMGLSPLLYGPLGSTYGRKWPLTIAAVTFTGFSAGSALAPNLACYFVMRLLTAFQGTAFLICGGTVIGDIYRPVERGTAYGFFLSGTLIGPALGPFIAGIIVTYRSWRDFSGSRLHWLAQPPLPSSFSFPRRSTVPRRRTLSAFLASRKQRSSGPGSILAVSCGSSATRTSQSPAWLVVRWCGTCTRSSRPSDTCSTHASS